MKIIDCTTILHTKKYDICENVIQTGSGEQIKRPFVRHPGSVVLLPLLPDNRVVMIRNYRHSLDHIIVELPAGTCDAGEPCEQTAERELLEETGYQAGKLEKFFQFYPAPGFTNELMHLFVATELQPGNQALEVDEQIEPFSISLAKALEMTQSGEIADGKTMVALWHFAHLHPESFTG